MQQLCIKTHHPLHCRMNGHRFDIMHGHIEKSEVATHFNSDGYREADLTVMITNKLWRKETTMRKIRERRWIRTLGSLWPMGITESMNEQTVIHVHQHHPQRRTDFEILEAELSLYTPSN